MFDEKVGPAARRLAYHALMKDPSAIRDLFMNRAPAWERAATRAFMPVMIRMMKRGLKIDDAGAARSEAQLTAADLTLASLMTPLIVPQSFADAHLCASMLASGPARAMVARHRETPAGRFVLRAYEKERSSTAPTAS